jgi:hypothetical protein
MLLLGWTTKVCYKEEKQNGRGSFISIGAKLFHELKMIGIRMSSLGCLAEKFSLVATTLLLVGPDDPARLRDFASGWAPGREKGKRMGTLLAFLLSSNS